jgi:hypothetical protein
MGTCVYETYIYPKLLHITMTKLGAKLTPIHRKHMSEARLKYFSEHPDAKEKLSASLMGRIGPNTGKHHTEAHKQKLRVALSGKPKSKETLIKLSISHMGKSFTREHREHISKALVGKTRSPLTDEHRKNLSVALLGKKCTLESIIKSRKTRQQKYMDSIWMGSVRYYDTIQYCDKWNEDLRNRVRAWFGYKCVACGVPQTTVKLSVHHVWYNKNLCCDDTPRSLVALCQSCHSKTISSNPTTRQNISSQYQEIINSYYGGRCWLTKDELNAITGVKL